MVAQAVRSRHTRRRVASAGAAAAARAPYDRAMPYDWRELRELVHSDAWKASFVVEPPIDEAALAPIEALVGPLPAAYRSFVTEVASAIGGFHLLPPAQAARHLHDPGGAFPALTGAELADLEPRRFGFTPAEADAAMARIAALLAGIGETDRVAGLWKLAGTDALAGAVLEGNELYQGTILALDFGCAEYAAIVHDGPLRDTVWSVTEAGWYPELRLVDDRPVAHDLASYLAVRMHLA
jgi:hypothetical protein